MASATPLSPPPASGNVAAAAALRFSVDFDPSRADAQPSVLLLTQNVGGIEAALSTTSAVSGSTTGGSTTPAPAAATATAATTAAAGGGGGARSLMPDLGRDISTALAAMSSAFAAPSFVHIPDDVDVEVGVPQVVRQQVAEFLADLRQWLHRMSYVSAAVRAAEARTATAGSSTAAAAADGGDGVNGAQSPTSGTLPNADAYLRSYTPLARPPLIDVVVLHFQEIGGKYKNTQFNAYFQEQVRIALLPEAGWTSGLLIDERESGGTISSSRYRRPQAPERRRSNFDSAGGSGPAGAAGRSGEVSRRYSTANTSTTRGSDTPGPELDPDADVDAFFTAIGSIVFLSPRVMGIASCLSVPHRTYIPIIDDPVTYAGEAGSLFHSGKFAEAGRSRKGYLLLSLRLGTVQFNVCNVHLFNDDDNRVALAASPSSYASRRVRAMLEAVAECSAVVDLHEPLFVFGDFNVRMDGPAMLRWVEETMQVTVRPEKKQLRCPDHFWDMFHNPSQTSELQTRFDTEPQHLMDEVALVSGVEMAEMPVRFAPTYSRLPYRSRTGNAAASGGGGGAAAAGQAAKRVHSEGDTSRDEEASYLGRVRSRSSLPTTTPSSLSPTSAPLSRPSSPQPPQPHSTANAAASNSAPASVPLSHATASPTRDNFCRDRLPAWCDRVLFNVAGLEWIAGDRARPAPPQPASPSATAPGAKGRRRAEQERWYTYASIDLMHTDHDGVFLLF